MIAIIRPVAGLVAVAVLVVARLGAQGNPPCRPYTDGDPYRAHPVYNLCNAAIDGAALFTPAVGLLMTGGSALPGSTTGLRSFGRLDLTLRVNATSVVIPDLDYDGATPMVGAQRTVLAPAPLIEAGFGLLPGVRHGALALDLLGSAQLLPTRMIDDVRLDVNARAIGTIAVGLGIGARLTVLAERRRLPGITVSVMHRSLPRLGVGDLLTGDLYAFALQTASTEYRVVVGKQLRLADVGVGGGWTSYHAGGDATFRDPLSGDIGPATPFAIDDGRTVGFVDGGLRLGQFHLIGEAGLQQGKSLALATTFARNDPAESRRFGSLGLSLGF